MTEVQEVLAKNIKYYRKQKGYTQEQLAEKTGTSTNYIGTIEIGKKYPSPNMLEKLSNALEVSALNFFEREHQAEFAFSKANDKDTIERLKHNISAAIENTFSDEKNKDTKI